MLSEVFVLTCANGCRLAIISKDFYVLKALIIIEVIAILAFSIKFYYLLMVGTFGNESRGYAIFAILFALAYSCKRIWQVNKKYNKTNMDLNIKDIIL